MLSPFAALKEFRLCGLSPLPCPFDFRPFTGNTFAVQSHLLEQIEGLHGKAELVLHNGQAASVVFHGRFSIG
jgi:hypothetical protein